MAEKKRISVKYKTPNPLFEKWLTEWYTQAKVNDSKMQYTFMAALKSLRKYPLPLESGKECIILKGFGNKLCDMLDKKLNDHNQNKNNVPALQQDEPKRQTPTKTKPTKEAAKSTRPYKPAKDSGPYAILLALLKMSQELNNPGSFTKAEIIEHAKHLCNKSFTKPEPGSFYTAWTSMSTLVTKGLVLKKGSPVKFKLSDTGEQLSIELFQEMENAVPETEDIILAQNINNSINNMRNTETIEPTNLMKRIDDVLLRNDENSSQTSTFSLSSAVASTSKSTQNTEDNSQTQTSTFSLSSAVASTSKLTQNTEDNSQTSQASSNTETIIFQPGTFDIILIVDTHETGGGPRNPDDETIFELNKYQIKYEVRHLKVGDFTWICREKDTKEELILPYIAERKRMDDLGHSIKDGRFHEQKFRLKQCGIQNLIYIVENYGNNTRTCLPLSSLLQGATNTLIQDKFQVKFTESHKHSMQYLSGITMMLSHVYEQKTLMSCAKDDLENTNVMDDLIPLMIFKDFNKGASKTKKFKVKEIFLRQLLQLNGVSVDKALAIANKYPTPKLLKIEYDVLDRSQGEKLLANITFGPLKKSIGPVISKTIYQLYTLNSLN